MTVLIVRVFATAATVFALGFNAVPGQAQEFPYTLYTALGPVSGISGVQALSQASGIVLGADAVVGQSLQNNFVQELGTGLAAGDPQTRSTGFLLSGNRSTGLITINQEAGTLNNQSNVYAISLFAGDSDNSIQAADLAGVARTTGNTLVVQESEREDRIQASFTGTTGVVGINQTVGNLNQQANILVLTEGLGQAAEQFVALGPASLDEVVAGNSVTVQDGDGDYRREDRLLSSFRDYSGIAQVNQSAGDLNVVRNGILVSLNGLSF